MSDSVKFEIPDLAAYMAELEALPRQMRERVMRGAVATGAAVVMREARRRAPMSAGPVAKGHPPPGTLKKAIYQTRLPEKCTNTSEVFKVDVRMGRALSKGKGGKQAARPDAYYALWVERGHWTRAPGLSRAQHRRAVTAGMAAAQGATWVPAQPFMRPAFEAKRDEALRAMQQYLDDNLPLATGAARYIKAAT